MSPSLPFSFCRRQVSNHCSLFRYLFRYLFSSSSATDEPSSDASLAPLPDMRIDCLASSIAVTLLPNQQHFAGLIYPKGLATNSSCMIEYDLLPSSNSNLTYHLPLRSCNTMSNDLVRLLLFFLSAIVVTLFHSSDIVNRRFAIGSHVLSAFFIVLFLTFVRI
jgi:hypothetical protein